MADHTEVMKAVSQLPYTNTFYPVLVPNIKGGYILVTLLALATSGRLNGSIAKDFRYRNSTSLLLNSILFFCFIRG